MNTLLLRIINNEEKLYFGNLHKYYRDVFFAPNSRNRYHNFRHMTNVFCRAYEGGKYEKLDKIEMRALLIAAFFHDFGHSGQGGDDAGEIKTAINYLESCLLEQDEEISNEIKDLIYATQYPHRQDMVIFKSMKIIRDADCVQVLSNTWLQQVIFGLSAELNMAPIDLLRQQISFLGSLQLQSDWGKKIYQPRIPAKIKEVKAFLKILN